MRRFAVLAVMFCSLGAQAEPRVWGYQERALLPELNLSLQTKLDTGALTASLHATEIEKFERDDEDWVRFRTGDGKKSWLIERPIEKHSRIKRRSDDLTDEHKKSYSRRPVILMPICIGDQLQEIPVNLVDRSRFVNPLLIGREGLETFAVLIDPKGHHLAKKPRCQAPSDND
ncbi:ATP-dependent zinc protease family protein [Atopomonas sediminilitoris]|uniref:ATP-dependent zinc protease family protein n=1 Tax=Atopomonas sediminilitoris TaxID=2919919 RepID=UPI001F4E83E8|nr:RimK/LysX family protein [Atopomonas sediminilitoris]MCJ8168765.1 RimK/LysX family protein [Atopomonas sediminilitoris]